MFPRLLETVHNHSKRFQFQICVSDNASSDATPSIIHRNASRYSDLNLRHETQSTNLGFAGNVAAVSRLATGDTLVVLADDDELEDGALDLLLTAAELITPKSPLALFDSLPGGDAVYRGKMRPAKETTIESCHDLLRRLGIFHASFVSNLMFHRQTALCQLTPDMLQSRYPHTALALTMLHTTQARFWPLKLVRVILPPDTGEQPLLTSVDMARVMSEFALSDSRCRSDVTWVYSYLLRMLPTAIYLQRIGRCLGDPDNLYADLRIRNVQHCYRHSLIAQVTVTILWLIAWWMPLWLLGTLLRRLSRHPR
jgi:glycosyltransferase involved in cell wall biosynthesis